MSESQGVTGDGIVEFTKSVRPRGMGKTSIRCPPLFVRNVQMG